MLTKTQKQILKQVNEFDVQEYQFSKARQNAVKFLIENKYLKVTENYSFLQAGEKFSEGLKEVYSEQK